MNLAEAKEMLDQCVRIEESDEIFGGCAVDVDWVLCDVKIADGHFNPERSSVFLVGWTLPHQFKGIEAKALRTCGTLKEKTNAVREI